MVGMSGCELVLEHSYIRLPAEWLFDHKVKGHIELKTIPCIENLSFNFLYQFVLTLKTSATGKEW